MLYNDHRVMYPLAQYIHTHPALWKDFKERKRLPKRRERIAGPEKVTEHDYIILRHPSTSTQSKLEVPTNRQASLDFPSTCLKCGTVTS